VRPKASRAEWYAIGLISWAVNCHQAV